MKTRRFRQAREDKMTTALDQLIEYFALTKQMEGSALRTVEWYKGMLGQFHRFPSSDGPPRRSPPPATEGGCSLHPHHPRPRTRPQGIRDLVGGVGLRRGQPVRAAEGSESPQEADRDSDGGGNSAAPSRALPDEPTRRPQSGDGDASPVIVSMSPIQGS